MRRRPFNRGGASDERLAANHIVDPLRATTSGALGARMVRRATRS